MQSVFFRGEVRALTGTTCKRSGGNPVCPFVYLSVYPPGHARPGMAARTGDGEGETPATVFDNNAGIVTTAGSLAESSTSSSSSSATVAATAATAVAAAVPSVILTESTATSAGSLPLGSQQQGNLHQVHQQQQSRQRVNLIADVAVNDVAGNLNDSRSSKSLLSLMCRLPTPLPSPSLPSPFSFLASLSHLLSRSHVLLRDRLIMNMMQRFIV
ncbi:uncharacterized protein [Mycetomoellerius zeteki]|uniref:uncharacterized protein n=1 Tax=Mycetomoellerius zeteki TaxID=64791 RepID=UPI00084E8392|nr:PREDICTED: uncharacterized protein LOC108728729 [Trachymyrmex zeteki]